jgi:hypothetical protein
MKAYFGGMGVYLQAFLTSAYQILLKSVRQSIWKATTFSFCIYFVQRTHGNKNAIVLLLSSEDKKKKKKTKKKTALGCTSSSSGGGARNAYTSLEGKPLKENDHL